MKPKLTTYDVSCNINNHSKEEILEAARPHADHEAAAAVLAEALGVNDGRGISRAAILAGRVILTALGADDEEDDDV